MSKLDDVMNELLDKIRMAGPADQAKTLADTYHLLACTRVLVPFANASTSATATQVADTPNVSP